MSWLTKLLGWDEVGQTSTQITEAHGTSSDQFDTMGNPYPDHAHGFDYPVVVDGKTICYCNSAQLAAEVKAEVERK